MPCGNVTLLRPREVASGRLFESGAPARSMFLVERGRVEISVYNAQTSKTTRLASFGAGSIFGEVSMLSTGVRTACGAMRAAAARTSSKTGVGFGIGRASGSAC